MLDTIITIGSIVTAIGAIIGAAIKVHKAANKFEELQEQSVTKDDLKSITELINNYNKSQEETSKCILRHEITSIYYTYKETKSLPEYVKEDLSYLYAQYEKLNGNSYVKSLVEVIKSWDSND